MPGRNKCSPGLTGLGLELNRLSRDRRDVHEKIASRALDFPASKLLITLQVLVAMWTGKLVLAHTSWIRYACTIDQMGVLFNRRSKLWRVSGHSGEVGGLRGPDVLSRQHAGAPARRV